MSAPGENVGKAAQAVCSAPTLSASPSNATPGTFVTWTATATCDTGETPEYQFWLLAPGADWTIVQDYATSDANTPTTNTYTWDTTSFTEGTYTLGVWVRYQGSSDAYEDDTTVSYVISTYAPCSDGSLTASPVGAQQAGSMVTLTMSATCDSTAEYQFWMLAPGATVWTSLQDYATTNPYGWDTTSLTAGEYQIGVWVRNQGSSADYETFDAQPYALATYTCADVNNTVGCCTGNDLYFCNSSMDPAPVEAFCSTGTVCGWNTSAGYYDCVSPPSISDPSMTYPLDCP